MFRGQKHGPVRVIVVPFRGNRSRIVVIVRWLPERNSATSKLLGHANVKTTQIYTKIVDSKKTEAVKLVDNVFDRPNILRIVLFFNENILRFVVTHYLCPELITMQIHDIQKKDI